MEPGVEAGVEVRPESLNQNANILVELAGALGAGRPDRELARRGCAPASPDDLSDEIRAFADTAGAQFQGLVAVLSALSTRLREAAGAYAGTDQANAEQVDQFLRGVQYLPPAQR